MTSSGGQRLSVVIPTRSREQALLRCLTPLRSGLGGRGVEVIVTDDGTGDATRTLVASSFPEMVWTAGPRRGPAANRNHGASLARGEFIVFVDDDVIPSDEFLGAYDGAIRDGVHVYEGKTTCRAGLRSPLEAAPINETGGWLWSCNMMIRRSFWESFGGFDEAFRFAHMEDVVFRERLKKAGIKIQFVPDAVVDHPPRRIPSGAARARIHESHFIYHYKYLKRIPTPIRFVKDHLAYYSRVVAKREKSLDSLVAVASVLRELGGVMWHWREWDERYRHLLKE